MAKLIFVAHPMSGDIPGNTKKVLEICKLIHSADIIPVFPSLLWRKYLEDTPEHKTLAEAVNAAYLRQGVVSEVWFYGDRLTVGMEKEARMAFSEFIACVGKTPEMVQALHVLLQQYITEIENRSG